ncbi:MAG TPA: hypothetical protein VFV08_07690 [Puia sp.]|nr:hypothetical protein [Puia sp.]
MANPTFTREQALQYLQAAQIADAVTWLGFRASGSKYGEYDDTLALFTPDSYTEFKGNTLPSKWGGDIAKLLPGTYKYSQGLHGRHHLNGMGSAERVRILDWLQTHKGQDYPQPNPKAQRILPYWAFVQSGPVTVLRHLQTVPETITDPAKYPMINLHSGGWKGTSSLGCQTFYPDHWLEARAKGYKAMDDHNQHIILYHLVEL